MNPPELVVVLPMAGRSSRFTQAGYALPKYRLPLHGRAVLDWVLLGFRALFERAVFVFACRDDPGVPEFVAAHAGALGIRHVRIVRIAGETAGQCDTVLRAVDPLQDCDDSALLVFNIDSFRPGFTPPDLPGDSAGWLETFTGQGDQWSFVAPHATRPGQVARTTEKQRISDLCSTGMYGFRSVRLFREYARRWQDSGAWAGHAREFYVAPLYNALIADGRVVHHRPAPPGAVLFCGVPAEYEELKASGAAEFTARFLPAA